MPKSKKSRACDISAPVKKRVWERDKGKCVICGNHNAFPNAHYIPRSKGGLGIEENIVTMCIDCHYKYDFMEIYRAYIGEMIKEYLCNIYPYWNEEKLLYKRRQTD